MKLNITHIITRESSKGHTYYIVLATNGSKTLAFTLYGNTPVAGKFTSMADLALAVSCLSAGEFIPTIFALDVKDNVQVLIVE